MHVHNIANYLKSLGPTEAELLAALNADQKHKQIKVDSEATEKIRKFEDQVSKAKNNPQGGSGSHSKWADPEKDSRNESDGEKQKISDPEDMPPFSPTPHIDIKI